MTFKEELTAKANNIKQIREHIERIKAEMEENFKVREYRISVFTIKSKPFAVGKSVGGPPSISLICPENVDLTTYTTLIIKELNKLGFSTSDMCLTGSISEYFNCQTIILRW